MRRHPFSFPHARGRRFRNLLPALLLGIAFAVLSLPAPAPALIVQDGRVVPEWPRAQTPLKKPGAATSGGMGFYPAPKGTIWGVTLLVDFPDQAPAFGREEVREWLNAKGFSRTGCNGSVRDYFADVSNGQVDLRNEVHGYYRARHPKTYYDGGTGFERANELLEEVFAHFDPLVDFSRFDNDGDGFTEAVSIVYAGAGAVWGRGIWPHAGAIHRDADGVTVARYMMTDLPDAFSLYVFAHECGHMIFGWPDLYFFGDYCLMGNRPDEANPPAVNDFYRADQGWIPVTDIRPGTSGRFAARHGAQGFRFVNPDNPEEMFFWSNLKNAGRRSVLGGSGLLVFHFDRSRGGNASPVRRGLFVVEADGRQDLTSSQWPYPGSAPGDFFHAGTTPEFSSAVFPAARWNDGSGSGLRIHAIGPAEDEMVFQVGGGSGQAVTSTAPSARQTPSAGGASPGTWRDVRGAARAGWTPKAALAPGVAF